MARHYLHYGATFLCLAMPALAQAQSRAPAETAGVSVADIIVTAQRRNERLVDVPISLNSVSREELDRKQINSVLDLAKAATSLRFEGHIPAFQPTLRGIGSQVQGAGTDSNVAVYIDGLYQSSSYGMGFDLPNVSNIQVLKGPQGTLFGRNATGGAILVTTAEPSADKLTGNVKFRYAQYDEIGAQGYLSGPLNENIAAGLSIYYRKSDGYVKNIVTGRDDDERLKQFNIRPDILFDNGQGLKVRLIYEHSYNYTATGLSAVYPDDYNIFDAISVPVGHKPGETAQNVVGFNLTKSEGVYGLAEWQVSDAATLKSNTGYRHDKGNFVAEGDNSPLDLLWVRAPTDNKTFSQEFVLSGKGGRLDWAAGVNYYHNVGQEQSLIFAAGSPVLILKSQHVKTDAWAGFADLTYEAVDGLFLTAGGRYSTEKKVSESIVVGVPIPGSDRWNKFTPRAVVRYQMAPNTNVYASYSKGFRSGAFTGFPPNKVNPETLDAYEVGFKHASRVFDVNASTFFYNYKGAQVTIIDIRGLGQTLNAGNQHNYGAELEVAIRPVPQWSINLAGAWLRAKYTHFENAVTLVKNSSGGWDQVRKDASGTYAPRSPKWTGNVSTTYDIDIGSGTVQLAGNVNLTSSFYHFTNEQMREPGFAKVDLNVSYTTADKHWRGELFVSNLTNHHSASERSGGPFGTTARYNPPRIIGGSIGYNF